MKILVADIGGTSIKAGIADNGVLISSFSRPTKAENGREGILEVLFGCLDQIDDGVSPIGISTAGDVDPVRGEIVYATENLPGFTGLKLKSRLEERYHRTAFVLNDALAALVGEITYGAGKGAQDAVMLTFGTGLGCAVITGGRYVLGANYRACRLGHIPMEADGRLCTCGKFGCLERYVSATGLRITAKELGTDTTDAERLLSGEFPAVAEKFHADVKKTLDIVQAIFDPQKIIFGGGLTELKTPWWQDFAVDKALLGNRAGMLGAAAYASGKISF